MLGPSDLVLCAGTVPRSGLTERIAAASAAGFSAISVFIADYERARAEGQSDADLHARLDAHGIAVAEVDPLLDWIPQAGLSARANAQGAEFFRNGEDDFFRVAAALRARSINAVSVTDRPLSREQIAEAFAGLCERAAEHGLLVHLEFLPWTQLRDAETALEIVELADRPNGGIMLDAWHHFRSRAPDSVLAKLPGARVLGVQLSDAPRVAEPDPVEETLHRRLLPGEGEIDLVALLRALREIGSSAPLGVEVFSDALAALPVEAVATRAGDATRALIAKARGRRAR